MRKISKALQIVEEILSDLKDREGFRQVWDELDDETRAEIILAWANIILLGMEKNEHE